MRILFLDSYPVPYAVDQVDELPMGGTHTVLCLLARGLADRGHAVTLVGTSIPDGETRAGVRHLRAGRWLAEGGPAPDVAVIVNGAYPCRSARRLVPSDVPIILWMQNDSRSASACHLAEPAEREDLAHTVFVSRWQAAEFERAFAMPSARTSVIPNALAPVFDEILPPDRSALAGRNPNLLVYASAPNRGLQHFRQIWPALLRHRPELQLRLVGGHNLVQYDAKTQGVLRSTYETLAGLPNVRVLRSMGKRQLAQLLRRSAMLSYPVTFRETFCLLAVEALAAGCLVAASAIGGLPEATAGLAGLMPMVESGAFADAFVDHTLALLAARDRAPDAFEAQLHHQAGVMRERYALPRIIGAWEKLLAATTGAPSAIDVPGAPEPSLPPSRRIHHPGSGDLGGRTVWGDGYVTDIEYTQHFFPVLAPSHLRFILAMKGIVPSTDGAEFDYMELGSGQGLTSLVLAASNPRARFYANDFNPAHVQRSRRLAAAAGLGNITFLETSFADLDEAGLPQMDFICLHGIYSWISPENQQAIVRFAGRHLKPGGVLYVSYNVTPGWAPIAPLQRLLYLYASRVGGPSDHRMKEAVRFVDDLAGAGAAFFKANPALDKATERMKGNPSYLPHEYLNRHWHLLTHAEVAGHFADAKLRFAASADAIDLAERFVLTEEAARFLAGFAGDPLRETIKDYLRNNNFRRDIFIRGGIGAGGDGRLRRLGALAVALTRPRDACDLQVRFPVGKVGLAAEAHSAILDALVAGPRTVAQLAGGAGADRLAQTAQRVAVLIAAGHLAPCAAGWSGAADPAAIAATGRLNRALLDDGRDGAAMALVLASPVLGSAVAVDPRVWRSLGTADSVVAPAVDTDVPMAGTPDRPLFESLAVTLAAARDDGGTVGPG
ncbi:hypothetical protein STVA_54360 [Allostella vacuolata]|nr:hypothetical protein STVA_54360 [Stella vacuolata]